jgi:hypothetical protein
MGLGKCVLRGMANVVARDRAESKENKITSTASKIEENREDSHVKLRVRSGKDAGLSNAVVKECDG